MTHRTSDNSPPPADNLERFLYAQEGIYQNAIDELKNGRKRSHWMWFIFPQVRGLGHSSSSRYFGIRNIEEAQAYLDHPVLGKRLLECAQLVNAINGRTVSEIFGYPDDVKLRSSMTLFAQVASAGSIFEQVLQKYFNGELDETTMMILGMLTKNHS